MKDSFLNSIVSSALTAQDQQQTAESMNSAQIVSGISEKDGYVGEMVKASLAIFENTKTPADYSKPFADDVIVLVTSLSAEVAETSIQPNAPINSFDSIQELIDAVSESICLDLNNVQATYGSDKKIHLHANSEYGEVSVEVGIEAYKSIEANAVLGLPQE